MPVRGRGPAVEKHCHIIRHWEKHKGLWQHNWLHELRP